MKTIHIRISSPSEESTYIVHIDNNIIAKVEYTGYLNGGGAGEAGEIALGNIPVHVKKAVEIMLESEAEEHCLKMGYVQHYVR